MAVLAHEGTYSVMSGSWPLPIGAAHRTGYLARPTVAGRFPVIVVLPSLEGPRSFEKDLCRRLARNGFAAVAIDLYREGWADALEEYNSLTDARALADLDEVVDFLFSPDIDWAAGPQVGVVGVDVGGRFGLVSAATRSWVRSLALCYAPLTGDEEREHRVAAYLSNIPVPLIAFYGAEDELVSLSTVDEAQRRNEHGQWLLYQGAGHGFLDIEDEHYDMSATEDAVARMMAFFRATLPAPAVVDLG